MLFELSLAVLLGRESLRLQFEIEDFVSLLHLHFVTLQILQLFFLKLCLIFEALILSLYVPLDFRNVFLSFALSILSEILKELGVLLLYSLLLSFEVLASLLFNLTQLRKKCLVA